MKKIVSLALVLALETVAVPLEARAGADAPHDWSNVQRLTAGSEIIVTVRGLEAENRTLIATRDSELVVMDLVSVILRRKSEHAAREILLTYWTELVEGRTQEFVSDGVRVNQNGLFLSNQRVAELRDIIQRINRADIIEVRLPAMGRTSSRLRTIATGTLVGVGIGFPILDHAVGVWTEATLVF